MGSAVAVEEEEDDDEERSSKFGVEEGEFIFSSSTTTVLTMGSMSGARKDESYFILYPAISREASWNWPLSSYVPSAMGPISSSSKSPWG